MFFGSKNLQSSACSMFDRMFDQSPVLFSANHASKIWTKRREQGLDRLFDDVLWDPLNVENLKIFLKFCFFGSNYLLSPSFSQLNRKIKHEFDSDDRFSESWPWKDKFLKIQASEDYLNYVFLVLIYTCQKFQDIQPVEDIFFNVRVNVHSHVSFSFCCVSFYLVFWRNFIHSWRLAF